jgi:hypothetical protein
VTHLNTTRRTSRAHLAPPIRDLHAPVNRMLCFVSLCDDLRPPLSLQLCDEIGGPDAGEAGEAGE